MANEPHVKGINLESNVAVNVQGINFETDNNGVALKGLNLETTSGTQIYTSSWKSATSIKS